MKFSEMFGITMWHADLLGNQAVRRVITAIDEEYIDDDAEPVPVVKFEDDEKVLKLNRRNAATLQEAFGDDSRKCIGKEVMLTGVGTGAFAWVKVTPVLDAPRRAARKRTVKRKSA